MVLKDYDGTTVWYTGVSANVRYAQLLNTGNLVLKNSSGDVVWQSFDSPTDTLLPTQHITAATKLVSTTEFHDPGPHTFRFSDQSILSLIYDGPEVFDIYWPDPDVEIYQNNRSRFNSTRLGSLDNFGSFYSSDFTDHKPLNTSDEGSPGIKRRLTLDPDGNLRVYSLDNSRDNGMWSVSWIAMLQPCKIHGLCGPYGICHYSPKPMCSCPPGYEVNNPRNWSDGCRAKFHITCDGVQKVEFLTLQNTDFWGFDQQHIPEISLQDCKNRCLNDCTCKGFQYQQGSGSCYPKSFLFNGRTFPTPSSRTMYLKLPKSILDTSIVSVPQSNVLDSTLHDLSCYHLNAPPPSSLPQTFDGEAYWIYFYGFIGAFFFIEVFFILFAWFFILRKELRSAEISTVNEGLKVMTNYFRRYSYEELCMVTTNFRDELGRGSAGIVYKGTLDDGRTVAVKRLANVWRGEEDFQAELCVVGRINHMNLVRIWGFCSESTHRMLVSEYIENGSLADALFKSNILLQWEQRFSIALGIAKGLAYLHHECLEWVVHCDVKPDNIFLDQNLEPKIADFGLAKILSRGDSSQKVSRIRGTMGYIAPEWVSGVPITAKADVYSYGVVLLELVFGMQISDLSPGKDEMVPMVLRKLVLVLADKLDREELLWISEFADFRLCGRLDFIQARTLIKLAVSCLEEDTKRRPTMESIVEILISIHEPADNTMKKLAR
jgi:hypothetical protein